MTLDLFVASLFNLLKVASNNIYTVDVTPHCTIYIYSDSLRLKNKEEHSPPPPPIIPNNQAKKHKRVTHQTGVPKPKPCRVWYPGMMILLVAEINHQLIDSFHHLGCIKPCKKWDKLPTSSWLAGFRPSTIYPYRSHTCPFGSPTCCTTRNWNNVEGIWV